MKGSDKAETMKSFDTNIQNEEFLLLSFVHHPLYGNEKRRIVPANL